MLVVAIDDRESSTELVKHVTNNFPNVYIVARAVDRHHVYELYNAGCRDIIRDTFDSSVRTGRSALEALGVHPYEAERLVRGFVLTDKAQMFDLASSYDPDIPAHENEEYVRRAREYLERYSEVMKGNAAAFGSRLDRGWVPPTVEDVEAEQEKDADKNEEK
jgi:CPA2 family monovalent cation:H+ antiporter-2